MSDQHDHEAIADLYLATVVRACLGQGLEVAVVRVERLPYSADGRFDEFVNLLSH